jgi:hypothetical protein
VGHDRFNEAGEVHGRDDVGPAERRCLRIAIGLAASSRLLAVRPVFRLVIFSQGFKATIQFRPSIAFEVVVSFFSDSSSSSRFVLSEMKTNNALFSCA